MTTVLPPRTRPWNPIRDGGACVGSKLDFMPDLYDEDAFQPVPSAVTVLCTGCSARDDCLKWAMDNDAYGFWAGTSRYQRLQLDRVLHRVKCPGCRSTAVMPLGGTEICTSCGMSWQV